jgi:hypothetical protein
LTKTDDFYELWRANDLKYGRLPLAIAGEPYFIDSKTRDFFKNTLESLQNLVEKVTSLFINGQFRDVLTFDRRLLDLILANPGYSRACPVTRWDSFFEGGSNLKFLELNTDGTSGMAYIEELERLYLSLFHPEKVAPCHFKEKILETLLTCYQGFASKKTGKPRIAIVDWEDVSTRSEQEYLRKFFNDEGYEAILADPRSLTYDGRHLRHKDFQIDLIYRRVVTGEYMARLNEVEAMTQAYMDQNVCVAGSFRSQIGFDKRIFEILSSEEYDAFFTPAENDLRKRHIPWTRVLKARTVQYKGQKLSIPEDLTALRHEFVIKPPDLNRGQGVIIGDEVTSDIWEQKIIEGVKEGCIVQERLKVPAWKNTDLGFHLGHFVLNGELSGWMCRLAKQNVLNDQSDERLIPCFVTL